jgi:hypothetical protein
MSNTDIIRNHAHNMYLNNRWAEDWDYCLGMAERYTDIYNDADRAWYADQKRSFLCYDV